MSRLFQFSSRLWELWDQLRSSFWFLPTVLVVFAMTTATILVALDFVQATQIGWFAEWRYAFGPESARAILSVIAGSMITVAGVTFSMTMLTLQLASSQFGPRTLRNFMRDRGMQIVLGTFLSTFVYCLLVLASVRGTEGAGFVPLMGVTAGMILALISLGTLIYFIHHIATSIRIETILAELAAQAIETVEWVFPERRDSAAPPKFSTGSSSLPAGFEEGSRSVVAWSSGYIQSVDLAGLLKIASDNDLVLRVEDQVGTFVLRGGLLVRAFPGERVTDTVADALGSMCSLGQERIPSQDIEFAIRRIVEIAQRALSPGINDPTTALYCLDRLGEVLALLASKGTPAGQMTDEDETLRLVFKPVRFVDLACNAFSAIARYGSKDDDLFERLLTVMDRCSRGALPADRVGIMRLHDAILAEHKRHGDLKDLTGATPAPAA